MKSCPQCGWALPPVRRKPKPKPAPVEQPKPVAPEPPPEPTPESADETTIHHHRERTWLALDDETAARLDVVEGDAVIVKAALANGETRELVAVVGTRHGKKPAALRVWLTDELDIDALESVTLKRRRRV